MKSQLKFILGLAIMLSVSLIPLKTMANYTPAYHKTAVIEHGYVDVSTDMGGETINGISRIHHPTAKVWTYVDVIKKSLPAEVNSLPGAKAKIIDIELNKLPQFQAAVKEFYKKNYWDALFLDMVDNQSIAEEMYDTAINQGVGTAGIYLQRCLNFLNRNGRSYPDIKEDGVVGQVTLGTLERYFEAYSRYEHGFAEKTLLKALNGEQYLRYRSIVINRPDQEINFAGWLRRIG